MKGCLVFFMLVTLSACETQRPDDLGHGPKGFSPCDKESCFSTTDAKTENKIDSLKYSGAKESAIAEMKKYAMMLGDPKLMTETAEYLHLRFDRLFGADDLEIYVNETTKKIEYKTRARDSYDFGANKSRAHDLAFKYIQKGM